MKWIALVLAIACGAVSTARTSYAEDPPPFWLEWGSTGSGDGEFDTPWGIAVHGSVVYVVETSNDRLQKFTTGGQFLAKWGGFGSGDGQFNNPQGVAVDASGIVFVSESSGNRIQKFSAEGAFLGSWTYHGRGRLALDPTGQFVYTPEGRFVYKYTRDGVLLAQWTLSTNVRESDNWAVAVGPSGNVYVLDRGENLVRKLTPDGTVLGSWGSGGGGPGQFYFASGIAVDGVENVYVADTNNARIQKFTSAGTFLVAWGTGGTGPGQFYGLRDIAVDADESVYCVDGNRIQKFGDAGTPAQNVTWGRIKSLYR